MGKKREVTYAVSSDSSLQYYNELPICSTSYCLHTKSKITKQVSLNCVDSIQKIKPLISHTNLTVIAELYGCYHGLLDLLDTFHLSPGKCEIFLYIDNIKLKTLLWSDSYYDEYMVEVAEFIDDDTTNMINELRFLINEFNCSICIVIKKYVNKSFHNYEYREVLYNLFNDYMASMVLLDYPSSYKKYNNSWDRLKPELYMIPMVVNTKAYPRHDKRFMTEINRLKKIYKKQIIPENKNTTRAKRHKNNKNKAMLKDARKRNYNENTSLELGF